MKKMEKFFKEEEGRVIHTRAECIIYTVKIDIGDPTLKLYPGFKVGIMIFCSIYLILALIICI